MVIHPVGFVRGVGLRHHPGDACGEKALGRELWHQSPWVEVDQALVGWRVGAKGWLVSSLANPLIMPGAVLSCNKKLRAEIFAWKRGKSSQGKARSNRDSLPNLSCG